MLTKYIRTTVVEGENDLREGLAAMINSTYGYHVISTYTKYLELLPHLKEEHPNVILASMECFNNTMMISACMNYVSQIKKLSPQTKVILLTRADQQEVIFKMLKAGVDGYLTRDTPPARLLESIREVYEGGAPLSPAVARMVVSSFHKTTSALLSPREIQVLELLAKGKTYTAIAGQLFIDKETARTHIKNIYAKLAVHSKAEAIEKAMLEKII